MQSTLHGMNNIIIIAGTEETEVSTETLHEHVKTSHDRTS